MNSFFLDASALAKRYNPEIGSQLIAPLFNHTSGAQLMCLTLGAAEVVSVLVRRRNSGALSLDAFVHAMTNLRAEVLDAGEFGTLAADNELSTAAMPFIDQHALNATDSVVLRLALDLSVQLRADGDDIVLVASDQRLVRAARSEGLLTFDPERQTESGLAALLTS